MRRGLLPVLLFVCAAGGTLFLGTRILASERSSAERAARETLRMFLALSESNLRNQAVRLQAEATGVPDAVADLGSRTFVKPLEYRRLERLAPGPGDQEGRFYLSEAERAEVQTGEVERAVELYRAASAEGRDPIVRAIALFGLAALERRRGRVDEATRLDRAFLAALPRDRRDRLEPLLVRSRCRPVDGDLAADLSIHLPPGVSSDPVLSGMASDAGVDGRLFEERRTDLALLDSLRPHLDSGVHRTMQLIPKPGPVGLRDNREDGLWVAAWVQYGEAPDRFHCRVEPLANLYPWVSVRGDGPTAPGAIVETSTPETLGYGIQLVAVYPPGEVESAARRGAWLLGGALAALLLAGGAAFVLSVRAARREAGAARARADFVTKMGHDLRTPLAVVRMYAETLAAGRVADPAEAREFASIAAREAERLTGMVGQVLDLSRVSEGTPALARRSLDLAAVVEEVAAVHRPLLEHAGMTLAVTVERPLPVLGDSASLRGAVSNLLENAGRHAAAGGSVAVEAVREGRMAVLRVLDRGPGIPAGLEESVFERFVRGPGAVGSGAGLGLALVREATEAHGGAAAASNREGGGAIFEVRLPLAEKEGA